MKPFNHILLETQYLPSAEYFALMMHAEQVFLERQEHYIKRSYRNRTHIAGANGRLRLSIPLKQGKNEQMPIDEVEISYGEDWISNHWRSIYSAYGNAPFFIHYSEEIKEILFEEHSTLWSLNRAFIDFFREKFQISGQIRETAIFRHQTEKLIDLRQALHPIDDNRIRVHIPPYVQVFSERHGYLSFLSALDLLFCMGPEAISYLTGARIIE